MRKVLLLLGLLLGARAVSAAELHVPAEYPTLQAAVDAAVDGDSLLIAPGIYSGPGFREIDLGRSIAILGADGPAATVLDGENSGPFLNYSRDTSQLLQGLTLRNWYCVDDADWDPFWGTPDVSGGAIRQQSATTCIYRDVAFEHCRSDHFGGALAIGGNAATIIEDCVFLDCQAGQGGGAVRVSGGSLVAINSLFSGNYGRAGGGAIYGYSCDLSLRGVTLVGNECAGLGAAVDAWQCTTLLEHCVVANHRVGSAALWQVPDENVPGSLSVVCSDLYGNVQGSFGGIADDQSEVGGNISEEPRFCDAQAGDYRLASDSPCLPAGNPCGVRMGALGEGCGSHGLLVSGRVTDSSGLPVAGARIDGGPALVFTSSEGDFALHVPAGWSGVLTPSSPYGADFVPPSIALGDVQSDLPGQDFALSTSSRGIHVPADVSTLSEAIGLAMPGDSVLLAPGIYSGEGFRDVRLQAKSIALRGEGGSSGTGIDLAEDRGHRILQIAGGGSPVIEGLTLRNAYTNSAGTALYVGDASDPVIRDVRFENCRAWGYFENDYQECHDGGAVFVEGGSAPRFEDVSFTNCSSGCGEGGALCQIDGSLELLDAVFEGNRGNRGGAVHLSEVDAQLDNCSFIDNQASDKCLYISGEQYCFGNDGGAIYAVGASASGQVVVRNCSFRGNHTVNVGKGSAIIAGGAPLNIEGCLFVGNYSSPTGVVASMYLGTLRIDRSTFASNEGPSIGFGPGSGGHLRRSIVTGGSDGGGVACWESGPVTLECNDVYGNVGGNYIRIEDPTGLDGNISLDPGLCDPESEDFTLFDYSVCAAANSPCGEQIGAFSVGCTGTGFTVISGAIVGFDGTPAEGVLITGGPEDVLTTATGVYTLQVPTGWSGTLTPVQSTYRFEPESRSYASLQSPVWDDGYTRRTAIGPVLRVPADFVTLQAAVEYAEPGDTVLIASGTYSGPGFRNVRFDGKTLVVTGSDAASTILDATGAGEGDAVFILDGNLPPAAVVQDLSIRAGSDARAILCTGGASPTLRGIVVEDFEATTYGVGDTGTRGLGLCVADGSHPRIENLVFRNCLTRGYGGAVYVGNAGLDAVAVTFQNCGALRGGAFAGLDCAPGDVSLEDCVFVDNWGKYFSVDGVNYTGSGGAIYVSHCGLSLSGCTFHRNGVESPAAYGGTLYLNGATDVAVENCIVAGTVRGSAIHLYYGATVPGFTCSDFWNPLVAEFSGTPFDPVGVGGNLHEDPRFCGAAGDDLTLRTDSPCAPANNGCGVLMGALPVACAVPDHLIIAGTVRNAKDDPLGGIAIAGGPAPVQTDPSGAYLCEVPTGWTGQLRPLQDGYVFAPPYREYSDLQSDSLAQDFLRLASLPDTLRISGIVLDEDANPLAGIAIGGAPDTLSTATDGSYVCAVPRGWTGQLAPLQEGRAFDPELREFTDLQADSTQQDFQRLATEPPPEDPIPDGPFLAQNRPNPFRSSTSFSFGSDRPATVSLAIYDITGRRIRRLLRDAPYSPGSFSIDWDGCDDGGASVPSGVYFSRLEMPGTTITRKLVLAR
ncbi:MAG: T9SS type A sorting domain-containing protein [Verrucomicrobiales bacterium]|nr:T9SS type A sorting domain-containing protein [Verrucomicrobiales bacterium]